MTKIPHKILMFQIYLSLEVLVYTLLILNYLRTIRLSSPFPRRCLISINGIELPNKYVSVIEL